ncbi:MAG: acetyl-CoA carboxylase biotin carboxyl carrier protein [Planctomycetota bacterium]|jgi:acetyl-CoA carboxylase biotin carboxyl carrier protein|nr:acetyl-CoA carboxylase biotin carboxyl carrier protein [Planctomycetota bacterium]
MDGNLEKIKILLDLMRENELAELRLEEGDFKVSLRKQGLPAVPAPLPLPPAPPPAIPAVPAPGLGPADDNEGCEPVKSPIVGTFYRGPSPDAPPFVNEGEAVKKEAVVCIIEAMKIMNEIKAGLDGRIERVLVESGEPVEYGQTLFLVRRD